MTALNVPPPIPGTVREAPERRRGASFAIQVICLVLAVMLGVASFMTYGIYCFTLVDFKIVLGVAIVFAALLYFPCLRLWKWMTSLDVKWLLGVITAVWLMAIGGGLFLFINFLGAIDAPAEKCTVKVESVSSESRTRYKRVGRRNVPNGSYTAYVMVMTFPDGMQKKMDVKRSHFRNLNSGDTLQVRLKYGTFGLPLVDVPDRVPSRKKSRPYFPRKR